jgi:phosphatidylglycerophosphatase A
MEAAAEAGLSLERRAVNGVLDSEELGRILTAALNSQSIQAALQRAVRSDAAAQLVDNLFESGLIDRFLERLLASDSLWHVIDEIAGSPAVTAAISQQGLGFADQLGGEMRTRSRKADDWMEGAARRLAHRPPRALPSEPDPSS